MIDTPAASQARRLLDVSALKRAKVRRLRKAAGATDGRRCLDIGGDNGVVSLVLRDAGGRWVSADASSEAAHAIRAVVGASVCQIAGARLPFASASLDVVVVADYLEHVEDDRAFVREIARVLKPGGRLVVNVPHVPRRSVLRHVRDWVGLTDAWHGHVRPGYEWGGLEHLLTPDFEVVTHETYCRAFSESLDIALNAVRLRGKGRPATGEKGPIVGVAEMRAHGAGWRVAGTIMRAWAALDGLLFLHGGYRLLVQARRAPARGAR